MAKVTRAASSVWLVGGTEENFKISKLPSRGVFNYHNDESMSLKDSIDKTASLLLPIWEMARLPTKKLPITLLNTSANYMSNGRV